MSTNNPYTDFMYQDEIEEEVRNRESGRVDCWETVPIRMQDSGAYDEGYGYQSCRECERVTEHDDCGICIEHNYDQQP
tara:strand:- start:595 stop:828 length:234 start_codon:yes stop_codon:yes gene_type:complete